MGNFYHALAVLCDELAATSSRLKERAAMAEYLRAALSLKSDDCGLAALYLTGTPFAETDPRKLNAGSALLIKAVRSLTGASDAAINAAYRVHGDLGAAAFDLLAARKPALSVDQPGQQSPSLALSEVAAAFGRIADASNTKAREAAALALLQRATPVEAKYLIKLMLGDMRTGVKQSLVEEALAVAADAPLADLRHAVMLTGNLAEVARLAFQQELAQAKTRLFHPLGFMLASPVETPEDAVARFAGTEVSATLVDAPAEHTPRADVEHNASSVAAGRPSEDTQIGAIQIQAFLEDKYDGMRVQLHCGDPSQPGRVALFSRNREDVTESFPEIAEAFAHARQPLILDGELLAWDPANARAMPFAILSQRLGRKRVSDAMRTATPVVFMAFDILYSSHALQLDKPLRERRALLELTVEELLPLTNSALKAPPAAPQAELFAAGAAPDAQRIQRLLLAPSRLVESARDIDRAYAAARERGNEGVMIKAADSIYQTGRRGIAWVKLKRELGTLDVVVTAAEFGHGRRAAVLSDYTFAVRSGDALVNVGKAYSGLTDAEIDQLTAWFKEHTLEDYGHIREVEPGIILEVAFNNVMRSSRHASGFALRFPRILHIRTDKPLSEIDTLERVEEIYQSQPDKPAE